MKKIDWWLIVILILAATLRLVMLDKYPVGINSDEAALGYNAYSIIQTGKDEYGEFLPMAFKSFGDYKPGLYVYFTIPFVALLGLNEWAVRLPSALLGIATVYLIFLLSQKLFNSRAVSLLASLMLAISPWHLHFSRGGWETNAATFGIVLGVWAWLKALENSKWWWVSGGAFLASMYLYQSPRLVVPVLILGFAIYHWRRLWSTKKQLIWPIIGLGLLTIPLASQFIFGGGTARFNGLSFTSDLGPKSRLEELRGEHQSENGLWAKLLHNKVTAYGPAFLEHYLDHFDSQFLFINGEEVIRHRVPETGQFYLLNAIWLIAGIIFLSRSNIKNKFLIVWWILVAPLASAMTFQTPNALRSLNMVIPMTLVMAYGAIQLFKLLMVRPAVNWRIYRILSATLLVIVVLFSSFEFVRYMESYYLRYPYRWPIAWEYGFKEMIGKLEKYQNKYDQIIITDRYDQPYILVLFYSKYDPSKYQPQAKLTERDKFNFGTVRGFDNFQFRAINKDEVSKQERTLYIGTAQEITNQSRKIDQVNFPNGEPAFIFSE